ncbi:MAG: rhodanese-like domain-containing protein [Mesorhizobium sp.]
MRRFIAEACARIRACGDALWTSGLPSDADDERLAQWLTEDADAVPAPELDAQALQRLARAQPGLRLVDVREAYEQHFVVPARRLPAVRCETVPLSRLPQAAPAWLALPAETPLVFICRSGRRSAQAAAALRRLGRAQAFSLAGGLALWPAPAKR